MHILLIMLMQQNPKKVSEKLKTTERKTVEFKKNVVLSSHVLMIAINFKPPSDHVTTMCTGNHHFYETGLDWSTLEQLYRCLNISCRSVMACRFSPPIQKFL